VKTVSKATEAAMSAFLNRYIRDGVAEIEIVNERKKNAITPALLEEFGRVLAIFGADEKIRAVLLTGKGDDFCTGMDIESFRTDATIDEIQAMNVCHRHVNSSMVNFSKPIIAALQGYVMGQGVALAIYSDIRIASEDLKVGMPEIKLGFPVSMNCIKRLSGLVGMGRTKEIVLFGDTMNADKALSMGLVNFVVPKEVLKEEAHRLANRLALSSPVALAMMKRAAEFACEMSLEACLSDESGEFNAYWATDDRKEGFSAFFEKREPRFTGR
jgi:enoyl-CoA hydratase/carnithine racemase